MHVSSRPRVWIAEAYGRGAYWSAPLEGSLTLSGPGYPGRRNPSDRVGPVPAGRQSSLLQTLAGRHVITEMRRLLPLFKAVKPTAIVKRLEILQFGLIIR